MWETVGNGHALVTRGHDNSRPDWMRYLANTGGEDSHQLSIDEMPRHRFELADTWGGYKPDDDEWHRMGDANGHANDGIADTWGYQRTNYLGNNQPHNNIQCSIVIGVWRRIG